jgi:YebC/PmpR family DNA-binding regulatory protein
VALLIHALTDNKNRTVGEIRHIFTRRGGNLADTGAVSWMFERKGVITVNPKGLPEDTIMELALDAGALDMKTEDDSYEIYTDPNDFEAVRDKIAKSPVEITNSEISMVPKNYVRVEGENAKKLMRLLEDVEEHDDVQNLYGNFDIDESALENE